MLKTGKSGSEDCSPVLTMRSDYISIQKPMKLKLLIKPSLLCYSDFELFHILISLILKRETLTRLINIINDPMGALLQSNEIN